MTGTPQSFAQSLSFFNPATEAKSNVFDQMTRLLNPSIAADIIMNYSGNNRPVRSQVVAKYKQDMLAGAWTFTGDPIRFNVEGELNDGQHRVTALAQLISEKPTFTLPFSVIVGLPVESIKAMDQNYRRTAGQQLGIVGMKNATSVAAGVRLVIMYDSGDIRAHGGSTGVSAPLIEKWVQDHQDLVDHVNEQARKMRETDLSPGAAFGAGLILARIDADAQADFFELIHQQASPVGTPANTLTKRLAKLRRDRGVHRAEEQIALVIKAWNAWREGRKLTKLYAPAAGSDEFPVAK